MTEIKDWFIRNFVNHTVPFWLFLEVLFIYGIVGIFCPLRKTLIKLMEFTREQLIADDWEVESQPVTITRKDFDATWKKVWPHDPQFMLERNQLAIELGL